MTILFHVTLAIGIAFICTATNAAPAQILQSDQTAANQKAGFDWSGIAPILIDGLSRYAANRIANGEEAQSQDAEAAAISWKRFLRPKTINTVSSQDAKAANFWKSVGPTLVTAVGSYLQDRIANGENEETQAQFLGGFGPLLLRGAGNYIANRIANGETVQNEEADAQIWGTVLSWAAPYVIDKLTGGEIAMSEVAKALPEEARAEDWRNFGGIFPSQLG